MEEYLDGEGDDVAETQTPAKKRSNQAADETASLAGSARSDGPTTARSSSLHTHDKLSATTHRGRVIRGVVATGHAGAGK